MKPWNKTRAARRQYERTYRERHPEKLLEKNRLAYARHRAERLVAARAYQMAHRESVLAKVRAWKRANPDKVLAWRRDRSARLRGAGVVRLTAAQWREIVEYFGGRCAYCGVEAPLTQDHIVPLSRGGGHVADNVVPACGSCNSRKHTKTLIEFALVKGAA